MRYERDFMNLQLTEDTVLSLGKFDGLHLGHELLMRSVFERKAAGLKAAVFTFDIPPKGALENTSAQVITTAEEKQRLFEARGVDYLIECPFTTQIMHMEAEDFVREIVKRLRVRCMVVGTDFRFGYKRRGDYQMLRSLAGTYGYELVVVEKMQYKGRDISSTYIREELQSGNIALANRLLGYPYFLQGQVIHGNRVGRTLGFPTVNIKLPGEKLLPPFGVYLSQVQLEGNRYGGITNIGKKPTVQGKNSDIVGAETYIYNFSRDVYDRDIRVDILEYVRPEICFSSVEELKRQLDTDIIHGRERLMRHNIL